VIKTIKEKEENDLISSWEIFLKTGLNFIIKKKAKMKAGIKIKRLYIQIGKSTINIGFHGPNDQYDN
jgi:hypothetical protein